MKFQRDGPKRRRFTRRELPNGQVSQWMADTNFKAERESRRAGLTGKIDKHRDRPGTRRVGFILYGEPSIIHESIALGLFLRELTDPSRERASAEREAGLTSSRNSERGTEEEKGEK